MAGTSLSSFYLLDMGKLKNIITKTLLESTGYFHIDADSIGEVTDVDINKNEDAIVIFFKTNDGTKASLLSKFCRFRDWFERSGHDMDNPFASYLKEFVETSDLKEESLEEIVDGDGNFYGDDDQPSNGTNKMVGTSVWDLDKVYNSLPKRSKNLSGDLGIGIITW